MQPLRSSLSAQRLRIPDLSQALWIRTGRTDPDGGEDTLLLECDGDDRLQLLHGEDGRGQEEEHGCGVCSLCATLFPIAVGGDVLFTDGCGNFRLSHVALARLRAAHCPTSHLEAPTNIFTMSAKLFTLALLAGQCAQKMLSQCACIRSYLRQCDHCACVSRRVKLFLPQLQVTHLAAYLLFCPLSALLSPLPSHRWRRSLSLYVFPRVSVFVVMAVVVVVASPHHHHHKHHSGVTPVQKHLHPSPNISPRGAKIFHRPGQKLRDVRPDSAEPKDYIKPEDLPTNWSVYLQPPDLVSFCFLATISDAFEIVGFPFLGTGAM